jgi:hypothetical protein
MHICTDAKLFCHGYTNDVLLLIYLFSCSIIDTLQWDFRCYFCLLGKKGGGDSRTVDFMSQHPVINFKKIIIITLIRISLWLHLRMIQKELYRNNNLLHSPSPFKCIF